MYHNRGHWSLRITTRADVRTDSWAHHSPMAASALVNAIIHCRPTIDSGAKNEVWLCETKDSHLGQDLP
jgi:hypothetical protein